MVAPRFTRVLSVTLIVALLTSSVQSAEEIKCPDKNEIQSLTTGATERYIVRFKPSDQGAQSENSSIKAHYDYLEQCLDKSKSKPKDDESAVKDFSFQNFKAYTALFNTKLAKEIENMPGILYIEKDGIMKTNYAVPQELYRRAVDDNPQKNDDRIDQAKRPLDGKFTFPDSAGKDVDIYVIDTGVRTDHSEFGKRARSGGAFCDGCNEDDENGHGTHVASIAAGKTLGVARNANIIGIRVLDANGSGSNTGVIDGMRAVVEQHQNSKSKKSVVNMSLGGGFSQAVNDAVDEMTAAGIHVVVAAGNESSDSCTKSPASAKGAITVGATNENDETAAFFSNTGKCNDIFAPGSNIRGADFKSKSGTVVFSGTSQACPHVAGTVALLIAEDGNKSPAAMAKALTDLSTKNVVKGINSDTPNNFLRVPGA